MTKEQTFFLQMLKDHLYQRKTQVPEGLDWKLLCAYANYHNLGAVCFCQCREYLLQHPELKDANDSLVNAFHASVYHAALLEQNYASVCEAFQAAAIPFIPIKGILIAPWYPEPALRTMGDIDLLVRPEDRERIRSVMEALGFRNLRWSEQEWDYQSGDCKFELQSVLLHEKASENQALRSKLNDFWSYTRKDDDTGLLTLDWNMHLLYLIAHIAKHIRKSGIGFRQFFDIAVLLQRNPEVFSWERIQADADSMQFGSFTRSCLTLCEKWFDVPSPLSAAPISSELLENITEKVFRNGLFGFQNTDSRYSDLAKEREHSPRVPLFLLKLRVTRKLLFPSYRNLCTLTKYEGLRGKPYLLPWYWSKRILRGFRDQKTERLTSKVLNVQESALSDFSQDLKELGL